MQLILGVVVVYLNDMLWYKSILKDNLFRTTNSVIYLKKDAVGHKIWWWSVKNSALDRASYPLYNVK